MKTYAQEYYLKNQDKIKARATAYRKSRPEYCLWQGAKHRAKRKGQEFSLSINDIIIPEICPILGISMDAPSLDRVDNTQGYTKENTRVISKQANVMKSTLTPELCLKFYEYMTKRD